MKIFWLACLAAVNPKLLAVDLILLGNWRPRLRSCPDSSLSNRSTPGQDKVKTMPICGAGVPRLMADLRSSGAKGAGLEGSEYSAGRMWIVLRPCFRGFVVRWA